jgi:hypothetical protein
MRRSSVEEKHVRREEYCKERQYVFSTSWENDSPPIARPKSFTLHNWKSMFPNSCNLKHPIYWFYYNFYKIKLIRWMRDICSNIWIVYVMYDTRNDQILDSLWWEKGTTS